MLGVLLEESNVDKSAVLLAEKSAGAAGLLARESVFSRWCTRVFLLECISYIARSTCKSKYQWDVWLERGILSQWQA